MGNDRKWIKWIVLAVVAGFLVGKIVSVFLDLFLSETWALLINLMIPVFIIIGLIIVLFAYQREKEKTL